VKSRERKEGEGSVFLVGVFVFCCFVVVCFGRWGCIFVFLGFGFQCNFMPPEGTYVPLSTCREGIHAVPVFPNLVRNEDEKNHQRAEKGPAARKLSKAVEKGGPDYIFI